MIVKRDFVVFSCKSICVLIFFFSFQLIFFQDKIFAQAFKRFQEGDKVKPILLKTNDGHEINTENYYKKNAIVVTFWKLSNPRSITSLKYMQKMFDLYNKDFNLSILSVYCPKNAQSTGQEEIDEIIKITEENNIKIPVLIDNGLKTFNDYGIISLPSTMILDMEGIAKYILAGFPQFGGEQEINKNIKKVLGIPEEPAAKKKYEPRLPASRNYKLAISVLERGNTDKAISYLKEAIELDPEYSEPYTLLGKLYYRTQKNEEAISNFRKSLELDAENIEVMTNYGFLCLDADMNDDALLIFRNIIEKTPESAATGHYGIGTIYLKNKVFDSARSESEQAETLYSKNKNLDPREKLNFAQNISNLAEIYMNLQDRQKAIDAYKKAGEKYKEILLELGKQIVIE